MILSWANLEQAPSSFLFDVAAQTYGILASPSMIDVHNRNISFWSPQAYFIGAFFSIQQLSQVAWLYRLLRLDSKKPGERAELEEMVDYVPYHTLYNISLGVWMLFWNAEQLRISEIFVIVNAVTQLYYVFARLRPMNTRSLTSILTNVVARTAAGISVLDVLHNGSIAYFKGEPATLAVKLVTGLGFGALSLASDWILGSCLVYNLIALAAGQTAGWRTLLGAYAAGAAGVVTLKNLAR